MSNLMFKAKNKNLTSDPTVDKENWELIGMKGEDSPDIDIDDTTTAADKVWSSEKIAEELSTKVKKPVIQTTIESGTEREVAIINTGTELEPVESLIMKGFGTVKSVDFTTKITESATTTPTITATEKGSSTINSLTELNFTGFGSVDNVTVTPTIQTTKDVSEPLSSPTLTVSTGTSGRNRSFTLALKSLEWETHYIRNSSAFIFWVNKANSDSSKSYDLVICTSFSVDCSTISNIGTNKNLCIRGIRDLNQTGTAFNRSKPSDISAVTTITLTGSISSSQTKLFNYCKIKNLKIDSRIDWSGTTPDSSYTRALFYRCDMENIAIIEEGLFKGSVKNSDGTWTNMTTTTVGYCDNILNVTVELKDAYLSTRPTTYSTENYYGFYSCKNMYSCSFYSGNMSKLDNFDRKALSKNVNATYAVGFQSCQRLLGCISRFFGYPYSTTRVAFRTCSFLSQCNGQASLGYTYGSSSTNPKDSGGEVYSNSRSIQNCVGCNNGASVKAGTVHAFGAECYANYGKNTSALLSDTSYDTAALGFNYVTDTFVY